MENGDERHLRREARAVTKTVSGRGCPVWGNTDLDIYTDNPQWEGSLRYIIRDITGIEDTHIHAVRAFKGMHNPVRDNYRAFFREREKREYPPVYRYKITIELEEITDPAEVAEFWKEEI